MVRYFIFYRVAERIIESMKTLIIVPAYNEEANIVEVVELIKNKYDMFDYVVINDWIYRLHSGNLFARKIII